MKFYLVLANMSDSVTSRMFTDKVEAMCFARRCDKVPRKIMQAWPLDDRQTHFGRNIVVEFENDRPVAA